MLENPVLPAPRFGDESLGHLVLQHDRRVGQRSPCVVQLQQFEQNRRGDVVRQIAGDAEGSRPFSGEKSGRLEEIALDDRQARVGPFEVGCKVAVDFKSQHAVGPLEERTSERAAPRSDFDEDVGGQRIDGTNHFGHPGRFEEMLPEPLARKGEATLPRHVTLPE